MKYSKLTIAGIPKSFNLWDAPEMIQQVGEDAQPEEIEYDMYPAECDEEKGENACVLFKYNESATGVYLVHTQHLQTLSMELSPWASEADVLLYAAFISAVLSKHKRARLYDKYAPLKGLTEDNVGKMVEERRKYLKRQLTTKEGFTMEGVNADFTINVAHLKPAESIEIQVVELQQQFVHMQWDSEE